ncbi:MBL fold metallo-hydrolase [Rhodoferax koreense]|uniref:MBL fold metallo-hydrolase n=1 Tax=Rhodoferax koreensis TaxID=1842727 RepID=A0A1P8JU57_9BURK|nr:MBL fold metallo-hydrolase [Rhodoferax koreense]APW37258.1 MBL fold metallo-hydrolase [Rhodoferax koreense]
MKLGFLGGAGTVTGSKYLVEHAGRRLLVDCGLFQGLKPLRRQNWSSLPVDAASIDTVVLTHAHIDHSGFLPRLYDLGFRGRVIATEATVALCRLLLLDSAYLQEEEARYANLHGFSKHAPALPLYTQDSARKVQSLMAGQAMDSAFAPLPGLTARFSYAGHILGAASLHLSGEGRSILFSGDLGRSDDLVMKPPAPPPAADVVLIESTYGNRSHPPGDPVQQLGEVISRTAARGGIVVVPAFAVGRAQALLYMVQQLKRGGRIPDLPVYLNSPMAANVTSIFQRHADEHRLSPEDTRGLCDGVRIVTTEQESRTLNTLHMPSIIISASGMATGGRVVHHLKAYAPDARNTVLFTGHQAVGTRGAAMVGGATQVRIHGQWIPVRAEVANLEGLSAHADREGLLAWLAALPRAPRHVYVTHGEPEAADALRLSIQADLRFPCEAAQYLQSVEI